MTSNTSDAESAPNISHVEIQSAPELEERPSKKIIFWEKLSKSILFWKKPKVGIQSRTEKRREGFRTNCLVETFVYLLIVVATNHIFHPEDPGYLSLHPHPFWLAVIFIPLRYKLAESVSCALMAGITYSYFIFFPSAGNFFYSSINVFDTFKEPILFILVSGVISEYTDALHKRIDVQRGNLSKRTEDVEVLTDRLDAANQSLRRLEGRIAGQFTSVMDIFEALAKTSSMTPDEIKIDLLDMFIEHAKATTCAYYEVKDNAAVRTLSRGDQDSFFSSNVSPNDDLILMEALRTKKTAHLGQMSQTEELERYEGMSLFAGPVVDELGQVVGLVSVEKIDFVNYNPHSFKTMRTIITWWSDALERRKNIDEIRSRSVFNDELGMYNYSYFERRIEGEFERAKRYGLPLSITLLKILDYDTISRDRTKELRKFVSQVLTMSLRNLDMVSCYRSDENIAIVFPITPADGAETKFRKIMRELDSYDLHPYHDKDTKLKIAWFTSEFTEELETARQFIRLAENGLEKEFMDLQKLTEFRVI